MDASNLLKPALARGELHCVGATTLDEYRKHVEKDAALARRFQPVFVDEPTVEDTISILRGLKEKYELHHGIRISDSALVGAATLSQPLHRRPLPARQGHRPDGRGGGAAAHGGRLQARGARRARPAHHAAQDRARGAEEGRPTTARKARLTGSKRSSADLEEEAGGLSAKWLAEKERVQGVQKLKEELDKARTELELAQRTGDLAKAGELAYGVIPGLEKRIKDGRWRRQGRAAAWPTRW